MKASKWSIIFLGTMLCYISTADCISYRMGAQRAGYLKRNLRKALSFQLDLMYHNIRLEKEARKTKEINRIVGVMNRYDTCRLNSDQKKDLARLILSESRRYEYDPMLVVALIMTESSFNPKARSWRGARGLMQIKPATGREVAKKIGLDWQGKHSLYDPTFNIKSGIYYLAAQHKRFGDLNTTLAAYNHGPTAVRRMIARGLKVPRRYAKKVMGKYNKLKKEKFEVL